MDAQVPAPRDILIVKLGALGDVLRTTPLLTAYKREFPGCRIAWVVDRRHRDILEGNPLIDVLYDYSEETLRYLDSRDFDLAINLDKDAEAMETITRARARRKAGFGPGSGGAVVPLDPRSEYAVRLGVDDELKFRTNTKTYQQICFEQAGLYFRHEEYLFSLPDADRRAALGHLVGLGFKRPTDGTPVIGMNTGAGIRFAGKRMPVPVTAELARRLQRELGALVLLLGGEDEQERNREIEKLLSGTAVINTGSHAIKRFAAMVEQCDLLVSGDTTAMHIAVAVQVPVVVYFASTCSSEIELYGRGRKVVSGIDCAPCYKRVCPIDEKCMKEISIDEISRACRQVLVERSGARQTAR